MAVKKLQRYQKDADARWGFDFDIWDRVVDVQQSLPSVTEDVLNPAVDGLIRRMEYVGLALAGEVGELCNQIKKTRRLLLQGERLEEVDLGELQREVADIFAYLLKLSNLMGWDLEKLYLEKMQENELRFAPTKPEP